MGQYHKIINLSRRESLTPWALGSGRKLMEFGQDSAGPMAALGVLLAASGAATASRSPATTA